MSRTRCRGFSDENGSWNTGWISRARSRRSSASRRSPIHQHLTRARRQQPQDEACQRRFAAARFADDAQHLAGGSSDERHAIHCAHHPIRREHPAAADEAARAPRAALSPRSCRRGSNRAAGGTDRHDPSAMPAASRSGTSAQTSAACAQRSRNAQPTNPGAMRGTTPGMLPSGGRAAGCPAPECSASSPRVYGCVGAANSASTGALSTTSPAYITETRCAMRATMPRSWVISSSARPSSRCSVCSSRRICACTVTSSAVVGSSAISSSGSHISAIAIITRWRSPPES